MTAPIPVNIAVEDALSEAVLRRIVTAANRQYTIGVAYSRGGYGYLKRIVPGLNNAARGTPFVLLTDLDKGECPAALIAEWLSNPKHHNFLFRVAVREVEAWVIADRPGFAKYLSVKEAIIPEDVDALPDPKSTLLSIVEKCHKRDLRLDLLPRKGSTSSIGPNYNGRMVEFVRSRWNVTEAEQRSPSLARTLRVLQQFQPVWET
jgi:hypothetical protein